MREWKCVSRRKYCQKLCKKLTEEEKARDIPHSLREPNGIIWWEIADTARYELWCVLRNIFSSCEACLGTGVKRFETSLWNKVSWTAGALWTLGGALRTLGGALRTLGGALRTLGGALRPLGGALRTLGRALRTLGGALRTLGGGGLRL